MSKRKNPFAARPSGCICQGKVDREKESLRKAQFGLVLNWAFVAQSGVPPRVEYALSELGESMRPILASMQEWGSRYKERKAGT